MQLECLNKTSDKCNILNFIFQNNSEKLLRSWVTSIHILKEKDVKVLYIYFTQKETTLEKSDNDSFLSFNCSVIFSTQAGHHNLSGKCILWPKCYYGALNK